jgi:hypothetical protein
LSRIISNKGLNSKETFDESTAINSSVMLSGARRVKEMPDRLDIQDYRPDSEKSDRGNLAEGMRRFHGSTKVCAESITLKTMSMETNRRPKLDDVIFGEIQVLLAEKRTALASLRTGIAVFALPLSVLSALIATPAITAWRR